MHENPITSAFTAGQGDKICYRSRTGYKDRLRINFKKNRVKMYANNYIKILSNFLF